MYLWPLIILGIALVIQLFVLIYSGIPTDPPRRLPTTRGLLVVVAILIALGAILQIVMSTGHVVHIS